jgi:3-carboxy-cis,cis-muconate cycloisomerase
MSDTLRSQFSCDTVSQHFSDEALLAAMARFEAALSLAQADVGLIPPACAERIARVCARIGDGSVEIEGLDAGALAHAARRAGTLAIPFVKALTQAVARDDAAAARWVHWGATSQDVLDTALTLQIVLAGAALQAQLAQAGDRLAAIADAHRATMMTGRTLLQAATPVSFGWKAACWLSPLPRLRRSLALALRDAAVLQLGGAAGTRAALGGQGDAVAAAMSARLALDDPAISWHASRDRIARLGSELALVAGGMARIGRDLSLLMQSEVGEVFEPTGHDSHDSGGRGGSSAMPHKRNPVAAMLALQAGLRAPGLASTLLGQQAGEHERGLGTWQGDWWTIGALFECAGSAVQAIGEALGGLRIEPGAMLANLERTRGFVYAEGVTVALAATLGKPAAQALMETLCRDAIDRGHTLQEALVQALANDTALAAALPAQQLASLFDPQHYTGDAQAMIDRTITDWRA